MNFTAHISKDGRIQTILQHCTAVKQLALEYSKKLGLKNISCLIAMVHDKGKMCKDFDDYINARNKMRRGEIDHCFAGAKYILELANEIGGKNVIYSAELAARVVVSHHGLHDWADENHNYYLKIRTDKNERYDEISEAAESLISKEEAKRLLLAATDEIVSLRTHIHDMSIASNGKNKNILKLHSGFYQGMAERLLQSVLVDADRTDTADFMNGTQTSVLFDRQVLWQQMSDAIEQKSEEFRKNQDFISKQRMSISDRCKAFAAHDVGVCRLIVPTGGGKTLSSMRFAIEYARRKDMDRIFYIAPFMSILEQNSCVIRSLMENKELFLEHHSNVVPRIADNEDELNDYELRAEKWDSPVIATTLVQFLNALFSDNMSCVRRMHRLTNSVIIIDEVQSIPVKCVNMFNLAVNFLTRICGCAVVLCSATQPLFENTDFPLILDKDENMTDDYTEDFIAFKRTELIDCTRIGGYTYDEAADFCYDKYRQTESLLVVVNTKAAAREIFLKLKEADECSENPAVILYLSTGMCPEHRRKVIERIEVLLKSKNSKSRVICVTTQLIEAGVDLSFKCVVRSLAGLDNAAQAAGRCNRNGEFDCSNVYIIDIKDENLSRLPEIMTAQNITRAAINSGKYDDLLSVEAMSGYFSGLYHERSRELSYIASDVGQKNNTNLVEMLSLCPTRNNQPSAPPREVFKTAGEQFSVIGNETIGVIVPYNDEAKELISQLENPDDFEKCRKAIRMAQKYSVGVYDNMLNKLLQQNIVRLSKSGCYILDGRYYSQEYGLTFDKAEPDVLIF